MLSPGLAISALAVVLFPSAFQGQGGGPLRGDPEVVELVQGGARTGEQAAGEMGETVVVARKTEELLEDVPASITVVSGDDIEASGWKTLRDASTVIPNFNITEFSSRRLSFPFVRGIGSGQGDPAVITYVDGVPQFGSGGINLPLAGVQRVEFLRGPQGTLYGRNSLGGVMQVITRAPSSVFEAEAGIGFGDFGQQEFSVSASGPLGDGGTLFGISAQQTQRDGFNTNDFTGNDVGDRDAFFGRGQLVFHPDDASRIRLSVFGESAKDGGFVLSEINGLKANPFHINQDFEGVAEREVLSPTLTWERSGSGVDFISITAFQAWDVLETADFDFSPIDGVRRRTEEEQDYFYQELRFSSAEEAPIELAERTTLKWLAGVSGFLSDGQRSAANDFRPGVVILDPMATVGLSTNSGDFEDTDIGLFGQATLTVDDRFDLTGGLRLDRESKDADLRQTFEIGGFTVSDLSSEFDDDFEELLPHGSVAYRPDDDWTVYGLASRGFKAGGFNLSAPAGETIFQPEESWAYEIGAKYASDDTPIDASLAVFHIDWEDMQLSLFDPTAGGYVDNAGESTSEGIELEVVADVTESVSVFGSAGYTDAEFDSFAGAQGNDLPFAPETTFSLGARYAAEVGDYQLFVAGDVTWIGEFFYDPSNAAGDEYSLANFRVGVSRGRWELDVALRNAFDEEYIPVAFDANPDPMVPFFVGENGPPQTLLVSLRASL